MVFEIENSPLTPEVVIDCALGNRAGLGTERSRRGNGHFGDG